MKQKRSWLIGLFSLLCILGLLCLSAGLIAVARQRALAEADRSIHELGGILSQAYARPGSLAASEFREKIRRYYATTPILLSLRVRDAKGDVCYAIPSDRPNQAPIPPKPFSLAGVKGGFSRIAYAQRTQGVFMLQGGQGSIEARYSLLSTKAVRDSLRLSCFGLLLYLAIAGVLLLAQALSEPSGKPSAEKSLGDSEAKPSTPPSIHPGPATQPSETRDIEEAPAPTAASSEEKPLGSIGQGPIEPSMPEVEGDAEEPAENDEPPAPGLPAGDTEEPAIQGAIPLPSPRPSSQQDRGKGILIKLSPPSPDAAIEAEEARLNPDGKNRRGPYNPVSGLGWEDLLEDRLANELGRAKARAQDLCVLLLGHGQVHDEGMRSLGQALVLECGFRDLLFHADSDSICAILPGEGLERGLCVAENLRARAKDLGLRIAVGVSALGERDCPPDELLDEARRALAKAHLGQGILGFRADPELYRAFKDSQA